MYHIHGAFTKITEIIFYRVYNDMIIYRMNVCMKTQNIWNGAKNKQFKIFLKDIFQGRNLIILNIIKCFDIIYFVYVSCNWLLLLVLINFLNVLNILRVM